MGRMKFFYIVVGVFIAIEGFIFALFVPPFQKPDEVVHYINVANLYGGNKSLVESRFINLPKQLDYKKYAHKYEVKFDKNNMFYVDNNKEKINVNEKVTYIAIPGYVVPLIGFSIGKNFSSPVISLFMLRVFNFLFFASILFLCVRIIPRYRYLLLLYAAMPMVVHQVTAAGYDVSQLTLNLLVFTFFVRSLEFWKSRINFIILVLCVLIMVFVKPGYYFYLLIPFIVLSEKFLLKLKFGKIISVLSLIFGLFIFGIFLNQNKRYIYYYGDGLTNSDVQWSLVKNDPVWFGKVLVSTIENKSEFYWSGFLGYFGWLDYKYPIEIYFAFIFILVTTLVVTIKERRTESLSILSLVFLFSFLLLSFVLLEFIFYINWTDVAGEVVEGVQGRYFMVLLPFVMLFASDLYKKLSRRKIEILILVIVLLKIVFSTVDSIQKRYYDFSKNIVNANELAEGIQNLRDEEEPLVRIDSRDKMVKYFDTSWEDKVIGFQIAIEKDDGLIRVPYRYKIMDEEGKKVLLSGYLTQKKLQDNGVYETTFDKAFEPKGKVVSLVIEPVVQDEKEKYFSYLSLYDEIQGRLLFIKSN